MRDAPDRIWIDLERTPSRHTCSPSEATPHDVEYVRADLSDALLREAMEALGAALLWTDEEHDVADFRDAARATLAKLRAHLEEPE